MICRVSYRSRSSPTGRLRFRGSGAPCRVRSKRVRRTERRNVAFDFERAPKQRKCTLCSAVRKERRRGNSRNSRAGSGIACGAFSRRAFANKAKKSARSNGPENESIGSKAELVLNGAEQLLLLVPVEDQG